MFVLKKDVRIFLLLTNCTGLAGRIYYLSFYRPMYIVAEAIDK